MLEPTQAILTDQAAQTDSLGSQNSESSNASNKYLEINEIQILAGKRPRFRNRIVFNCVEIFTDIPLSSNEVVAQGSEPILIKSWEPEGEPELIKELYMKA